MSGKLIREDDRRRNEDDLEGAYGDDSDGEDSQSMIKRGSEAGVGGQGAQKLTGAILAKAILPSPVEVKQCIVYTDLAIKMELILFDLSSSLWWSTLAEITIFIFSFCLFMVEPGTMGYIWLFLPHIQRALIGFILLKRMPTSAELVNNIRIPSAEKVPFSKISSFVIAGAKKSAVMFEKQAGLVLLLYTLCTVVALIMDLSVVFTGIGKLEQAGGEFGVSFILILAMLYFLLAFYFIGWVVAVRMRLPEYAKAQVTMGLLGLFKKMTQALDDKTK